MKTQESFCISPEVIIGFRALMSNFCFTNFNVFTHRIQWEESFEAFLFIVAQIKSRPNICWLLVTQTYRTFKDKQSKEPSIDTTRVVSGELRTCLSGSRRRRRRRRLCVRHCTQSGFFALTDVAVLSSSLLLLEPLSRWSRRSC